MSILFDKLIILYFENKNNLGIVLKLVASSFSKKTISFITLHLHKILCVFSNLDNTFYVLLLGVILP